jgi:hypothetical protein
MMVVMSYVDQSFGSVGNIQRWVELKKTIPELSANCAPSPSKLTAEKGPIDRNSRILIVVGPVFGI